MIESEIMAAIKADDPGTEKETEENKRLLSLFPHLVYVDEIPNEYCNEWCCRHLPWFIVTTTVGRFKIGWRKRVISLDWSETECATNGGILFPDEDTTKGKRYIYAWSLDDARRYIEAITDNVITDLQPGKLNQNI